MMLLCCALCIAHACCLCSTILLAYVHHPSRYPNGISAIYNLSVEGSNNVDVVCDNAEVPPNMHNLDVGVAPSNSVSSVLDNMMLCWNRSSQHASSAVEDSNEELHQQPKKKHASTASSAVADSSNVTSASDAVKMRQKSQRKKAEKKAVEDTSNLTMVNDTVELRQMKQKKIGPKNTVSSAVDDTSNVTSNIVDMRPKTVKKKCGRMVVEDTSNVTLSSDTVVLHESSHTSGLASSQSMLSSKLYEEVPIDILFPKPQKCDAPSKNKIDSLGKHITDSTKKCMLDMVNFEPNNSSLPLNAVAVDATVEGPPAVVNTELNKSSLPLDVTASDVTGECPLAVVDAASINSLLPLYVEASDVNVPGPRGGIDPEKLPVVLDSELNVAAIAPRDPHKSYAAFPVDSFHPDFDVVPESSR